MLKKAAIFDCSHLISPEMLQCKDCDDSVKDAVAEEPQQLSPLYVSYQKKRNQTQARRRIDASLKEFINRYNGGVLTLNEKEMRKRMEDMKRAQPNAKGVRECAAVVIYFALEDQMRLSFREYCKQNSLKVKLFNRKVNLYHKLFLREAQNNCEKEEVYEQLASIKIEEKVQQIKCSQRTHQLQKLFQSDKTKQAELSPKDQIITSNIMEKRRAVVQNIFDNIFKSSYFKKRKQRIISKIVARLSKIDAVVLQQSGFVGSDLVTIYYIIYAMLKYLGFKISYSVYKRAVNKNTGYELSKERVVEMIKLYERWERMHDEEKIGNSSSDSNDNDDRLISGESSVKLQQNQSIQLFQVQSRPIVLQQQFFTLEYCYSFLNNSNFL